MIPVINLQRSLIGLLGLICFLFLSANSYAQNVSGKVTDAETGEGIIGASLRWETNPGVGTVTDYNGDFTIELVEGSALVVSYIGYKTQSVDLGGRTNISIELRPEALQLEGVVVTALGVEKQEKTLGYSVQEVSGDILENNSDPNFLNKLSGQVAGLNVSQTGNGPGGSTRILLRGSSSLTQNDQPIYVIDGVIVNGGVENGAGANGGFDYGNIISNLNPDDIASISVLKGPGAAALYGSAGQNGAIVITTKKGRVTEGIGVNFSSSIVLEQPFLFPQFQNEYGRGSQGQYINTLSGSWGPAYGNVETVTNWLGEEKLYEAVPGQMQEFFERGFSSTHNIDFSAGTEASQTRFSANHYYYDSPMPNSNIERVSLNLRNTSKIGEKITIDAKVNYFRQDAFNRPNLGGSPDNPVRSFWLKPRSVTLDELQPYIDPQGYAIVWDKINNGNFLNTFNQNPYWAVNLNTNQDLRNRFLTSLNMSFKILPWLKGHVRGGVDYIIDGREQRIHENTAYKTTPVASFNTSKTNRYVGNYDFLLTASKNIDDILSVDFSVGGSRQDYRTNGLTTLGDVQVAPDLWVITNFAEQQATQSISHKRVNSLYSFAEIGYNNYLFLSLTARNDWSSVLPPVNNSFFYPSASLSWVFSDVGFTLPDFISFGKMRLSYAVVGNDTGPHNRYFTYATTVGHLGNPFTRVPGTFPNQELRPEETRAIETGLDIRMFNGRLNADITWYRNQTFDQIFQAPVPSSTGSYRAFVNAGNLQNQGIEVQLSGSIIETNEFAWTSSLNFTQNTPTLLKLTDDLEVLDRSGSGFLLAIEGDRSDLIFGSRYRYTDEGKLVINDLGLPVADFDENDNRAFELGHVEPDFMIGWSNTMNYKNFSLNFSFDSQIGGSIYSSSVASGMSSGTLDNTLDGRRAWYKSEADRVLFGFSPQEWIPTGGIEVEGVIEEEGQNGELIQIDTTITVNPQQYYAAIAGITETNLFDASFIRLREVSLSYRIPETVYKRIGAQRANLTVFANNIGYLMRRTYSIAPQSSFSTSASTQGIELFSFPDMRSYGFKLNVGF